jgi:hypothetical protein
VPEIILDSSSIRSEIKSKMRSKTGPEIRDEFEKTVEGWDNAPNFNVTVYDSVNSIITHVFPSGAGTTQYERVNEGAPPHRITPRRRGMLRFQTGYRPATSPRVIGSRAKSRFGNFISTPSVNHPGFEARKFDETIAEAYADTFAEDMQEAIRVASIKGVSVGGP